MNVGVHLSVCLCFYFFRVESLYHVVIVTFKRTTKLFNTATISFYILTSNVQVSIASHPLQHFFFKKIIYLFIYFLAVLGLHFCARASSSCGKRGPLFLAVRGPLTIVASLVAEHRLQTRRLSSCGAWT